MTPTVAASTSGKASSIASNSARRAGIEPVTPAEPPARGTSLSAAICSAHSRCAWSPSSRGNASQVMAVVPCSRASGKRRGSFTIGSA